MADLKIHSKIAVEETALKQIEDLLKEDAFKDSKIRIMPDVHAGSGCVIGFTGDLGDKVIPNIVGVDIGCGMHVTQLTKPIEDLSDLDDFINKNIPSGFSVRCNDMIDDEYLMQLRCYDQLENVGRIKKSLGTLGGGNHFIEVEEFDGTQFLVIHTGSRNLGKQIADIYQKKAERHCMVDEKIRQEELKTGRLAIIEALKEQGRESEIQEQLENINSWVQSKVQNKDFAYIEGEDRDDYLHDMKIAQDFANMNREQIAKDILSYIGEENSRFTGFHTVHNYIDIENNMVRKGAISAKYMEMLIIPLNMRDGSILGLGKGNEDWNNSAPHGAGRILSRSVANKTLSVDDFKDNMEGIYSTSVGESTLDESPMAYKDKQTIIDAIEDTVDIKFIMKPVYNFKAH